MVLFSPKMRRFLDEAVNRLSDRSSRDQWRHWATEHPQSRIPNGPAEDGGESIPYSIARIAERALLGMEDRVASEIKNGLVPDDDVFELENDLSMIASIRRLIDQDQKQWQKT